jgi:hypothetical protein
MSRVSSLSIAPGESSDYNRMNTVLASVSTISNAIGYDNLADEGVDIRNISESRLVKCTPALNYIERTTITSAAPASDFNNESATPLSMGGNVELDWTSDPVTMDANTIIVIIGEIAIGAPSSTLGVPDSAGDIITPGNASGVSAVIATKKLASAYATHANSRSSVGGMVDLAVGLYSGIIGERQTLTCIHVIEGGTDTYVGIAMCLGSVGATNYRLYCAQLQAIVFRNATGF